jgi:glycerate 2-kinase
LKILIASGSFKDVYNPSEASTVIQECIESLNISGLVINSIPMSDGGEYSSEVLFNAVKCTKISVNGVVNPYGKIVESYYLELDRETAYIGSSEILRLIPEDDIYKNPLLLSSFGLGQLISDAINRNYKRIVIGLGGTSTVDAGIGMMQALGGVFKDKTDKIIQPEKYFQGQDLLNIAKIDFSRIQKKANGIHFSSACDAGITIEQMHIPNNQKISHIYDDERNHINKTLEDAVHKYSRVVSKSLSGQSKWFDKNLMDSKYLGVAGGINISLLAGFNLHPLLGSKYFMDTLKLEDAICNADLVITGEGFLDNSFAGKTPIGVSQLAIMHGKRTVIVCGNVGMNLKKHFNSFMSNDLPQTIVAHGVETIISCHPFYDSDVPPVDYSERMKYFSLNNPTNILLGLQQYFTQRGMMN